MKKNTIGIIGFGFVGRAQAFAFAGNNEIKIYDVDVKKSTHSLIETIKQKFVFVCVPTPMKENGDQDLSYVEDFFESIKNRNLSETIFILKSTILPGTTEYLKKRFGINIVFNPEFLTEKTANLDVLTQSRIIIGGDKKLCEEVELLYQSKFGNKHFVITDSKTAELTKYMCNNFLTVKVSFVNEYFDLANSLDCDWNKIIEGFVSDPRIGNSHTQIPGPDGKRGFGGTCFPKDINAIITFSEKQNIEMNILNAAWKTNLRVRPEQDWNNLKGRAVSIKK